MADLTVPPAADGQRLDRWLKKALPELPYVAVQKMVRTGGIKVDGKKVKADTRICAGQVIWVASDGLRVTGEKGVGAYQLTNGDKGMLKDSVVYEDEALLILNKPAGLAAQAGSGVSRSLDRLVAAMWPDAPPKLTHRLDKDTTGLIVLAKTRAAAQAVTASFAGREVRKVYMALLVGELVAREGDIKAPLAKKAHAHGSRAVVSEDGDHAHTFWRTVKEMDGLTLVEATPHTGRMNQLRVHFAHLGCPIAGDEKYGGEASLTVARQLGFAKSLYLHAWKLGLPHPLTGETLEVEAALPPHFMALTANR